MSESRRLSDTELMAQLRRRSSDEPAHPDQWRRDFIVDVGDRINRAPPVTNRRLPALAGFTAAVAILLVLVVVMPGVAPGGGSPSPTLDIPSVSAMGARDFAARLANGELDGDTVLVTGRILPYDGPLLYGATCSIEREQPVQPNFTCALGRLDGTDPAVWVDASYAATPSGDATFFPGAPYVWAAPQPPIEGVLALSVDQFRRVTLLGRDPDDRLTSSLPEVSGLALESVALDEVRVMPAWLTGIWAPISCGPPDPGTYLADLPGRGCAGPSWLAPDPVAVEPDGYTIPDDWLQLQSNAYLDFAPDPAGANGSAEPRAGMYVIAKRLEGSGCPGDQPPCWQWEVIGRVTANADGTPVSTPSPAASPTPTPAEPAPIPDIARPVLGCTGDTRVTVHDETGLVEDCSASQSRGEADDRPLVENLGDDLTISWGGSICRYELHLKSDQDRYILEIRQVSEGCRLAFVRHTFGLSLVAPVDAADVDTVMKTIPEDLSVVSRLLECGQVGPLDDSGADDPTPLRVMVVDATRTVEDCTTHSLGPLRPAVVVENTSPTNDALQVSWTGSACDTSVTFTFDMGGIPYLLRGEREQGDCDDLAAHTIYMSLTRAILESSVEASFPGLPQIPSTPAGPVTHECPYGDSTGRPMEISILDHSGFVADCEAFIELSTPHEFVEATNVGSEPTMLEVRWEAPQVCTSMPARLEFWGQLAYEPPFGVPPPFVLQIDEPERPPEATESCVDSVATHGVRLALRSAVLSDNVEAFRTVGGRGVGVSRLGEHALTIELGAGSLQYAADEPIDVSASILYSGPRDRVTISGLDPNPGFGFQQLDGNIRQTGGGDWICRDLELRRGVPATVPFRKSGLFIPSNFPDTAAEEAYWSDPELRLPPGLYRFFVRAGGNMDGSCMGGDGRSVGAGTSMIIEVR